MLSKVGQGKNVNCCLTLKPCPSCYKSGAVSFPRCPALPLVLSSQMFPVSLMWGPRQSSSFKAWSLPPPPFWAPFSWKFVFRPIFSNPESSPMHLLAYITPRPRASAPKSDSLKRWLQQNFSTSPGLLRSSGGKHTRFGARVSFQILCLPLSSSAPWVKSFNFSDRQFLTCKMGIITIVVQIDDVLGSRNWAAHIDDHVFHHSSLLCRSNKLYRSGLRLWKDKQIS